jgi:L-fucose mutarotase/ribose pyranase (RbsD/FucU family)
MRAVTFAVFFALISWTGCEAVFAADPQTVPPALAGLAPADRARILRYQDKNFQSALSTCVLEALSAGKIGGGDPLKREDFIFSADKKKQTDQCIRAKGYDASDIVSAIPEGVPQANLQDFNMKSAEIDRLQDEMLELTKREEIARQATAAGKVAPVPEEYRGFAEGGGGSSASPASEMKIFKYENGGKTKSPAGTTPKPIWNPQ